VEGFRVPAVVAAQADALSKRYSGVLTEYEALTRRVRRRLCEVAIEVNEALLEHADLDKASRRQLSGLKTTDDMLAVLDQLTPVMF
jgi:hypothetical protein